MVSHFYTCGITVQPLNATGVETTSDLVVTAVPEQGPTCDVGRGIALQIRSTGIEPQIEEVDAWIYFSGRVLNISHYETVLSIRLPYIGEHRVLVSLANGAPLDSLNVTVVAADPFAPACDVTERPPGVSPIHSSVSAMFNARDFYSNVISETSGNDTFESWTYNSLSNTTAAEVHDEGNGSYRVVSADLSVSGTTFLFVQRNDLGIPGSPFEVYVFGPSTCKVQSTVGDCQSNMLRPITQVWAANSPCKGVFNDPDHSGVPCDFVPVGSAFGKAMIASSVVAGLYAAKFLFWIRKNRETVVVKLSQPFVCQLFLLGCILLNLTTAFHLGKPTDVACLGRPWIRHVALTFTSGLLVRWVLQLVAVDVVLLTAWTVMDRPSVVTYTLVVDDVDVTNSECAGGFGFPLFSIILWSWKACFNLFGVVIAAKTWSCEDGLGESQSICLSVYNMTLLGLANFSIQLVLAENAAVKEVASIFTAVVGTLFTVSILFGPKAYRSVSDVLRRNSSLGSGLDFSKIGKVAPITEDPSAEEFDGRSHLENRVPPLPPG
eukprot:jgi/Undpi1/8954/HiC_scaffold_26.g11415.m1